MKSRRELAATIDTKELCCDPSQKKILNSVTGHVMDKKHVACISGHVECLKRLNYTGGSSLEPFLKLAVPNDRFEIVEFLFASEPPSKQKFKKEIAFVMVLSAKHGKPEILRWALSQTSPEQRALNDAASFAAQRGHAVCFDMCLAFRPALSMACALKGGNADIVEATAERVERIDARDFALAAKLGSVRSLEAMLKFSSVWDETTPAAASRFGHLACLRFAHENGCKWNKTALVTSHSDCFDYAVEHRVGTTEKCSCVVEKPNPEESGKFFRNLDPPSEKESLESLELVAEFDPGSRNWAKRATLFSELHQSRVSYTTKSFFDTMKPSTSIKELASCITTVRKRNFINDAIALEEAAFRRETGAPKVDENLWLDWTDECLTVFEKKPSFCGGPYNNQNAISWHPQRDVVYARYGNDNPFSMIRKSKFVMNPKIVDRVYTAACFLFTRSLEDAFSIFCTEDRVKNRFFPKKVHECLSVEEMFSDKLKVDHPQEIPPPMTLETRFVMFLRKHGVCVTDSLVRLINNKSKLWKAPQEFGADQWVFKNDGIVYDTRSRMSVSLSELLENIDSAPDEMLPVLFLFSKSIKKLNVAYEEATVKTTPTDVSKLKRVSATDYCRYMLQ